jgi:hypothetical protein
MVVFGALCGPADQQNPIQEVISSRQSLDHRRQILSQVLMDGYQDCGTTVTDNVLELVQGEFRGKPKPDRTDLVCGHVSDGEFVSGHGQKGHPVALFHPRIEKGLGRQVHFFLYHGPGQPLTIEDQGFLVRSFRRPFFNVLPGKTQGFRSCLPPYSMS